MLKLKKIINRKDTTELERVFYSMLVPLIAKALVDKDNNKQKSKKA